LLADVRRSLAIVDLRDTSLTEDIAQAALTFQVSEGLPQYSKPET
jgi:hypothetical protein